MGDLGAIAMVMFVAWIASGIAVFAVILLAPTTWSQPLRMALIVLAAVVFTLLTTATFGIRVAAVAVVCAAVAAFVVYFTIRSRRGG